jgi:hypothetical protein
MPLKEKNHQVGWLLFTRYLVGIVFFILIKSKIIIWKINN